MAALDVVDVDLELRPRVDLGERREQQVAARLARIRPARGRGLDRDAAVECAAAAGGGDAAVVLQGLGGRGRGGSTCVRRSTCRSPSARNRPVEPAGGVRALEHEIEVRAQQASAEREQVLSYRLRAAARTTQVSTWAAADAVLVQAQVR